MKYATLATPVSAVKCEVRAQTGAEGIGSSQGLRDVILCLELLREVPNFSQHCLGAQVLLVRLQAKGM